MTTERRKKQAADLRIHEQAILDTIGTFRTSSLGPIITHVQQDLLDEQIEERQRKLETVKADDLKTTQGEIAGLRLAKGIVALKP